MSTHPCRFCARPLEHVFVDLGESPLSNAFVDPANGAEPERRFPLKVYVCKHCFLVQLPEHESADAIFADDYVYFSSYSDSWLEHAERYVEEMIRRFGFDANSRVIEIASNDGYLLQYFGARGIPVLGIEPAANVAAAAEAKGVRTLVRFFGRNTAEELLAEGRSADLLLGNNVLAHVPDLDDFVGGLKIALAPGGVITMEFPHLLRLIEHNQFDTIYHEHYSYLSFGTVREIFAAHQLAMFEVEELPTHGGSLRIFAQHDDERRSISHRVSDLLVSEERAGLRDLQIYLQFGTRARHARRDLVEFLRRLKEDGHSIAAYGAAAKGNTLLNYCGIGVETIDYVVDRNPAKQGKLLPGSRIPVRVPETIFETRPDYVLILPWNIKEEIVSKMAGIAEWGGRFLVAIPRVEILGVIFRESALAGVWVIEPERLEDERGFFARSFCRQEFERHGLEPHLEQCNVSFNRHQGTLRGLHYQAPPHEEDKLVRCTMGSIWDVAVDLRPDSPTYRRWVGETLSADNRRMFFIPKGFAHGFVTLEPNSEVFYQMSERYYPESARGFRYDDPAFAISWPCRPSAVSDQDLGRAPFAEGLFAASPTDAGA